MGKLSRIRYFLFPALCSLFFAAITGCGKTESVREKEALQKYDRAEDLKRNRKYTEALQAAREVISLAGEMGKDSLLAEGSLMAGDCLRWLGQYDSALSSIESALQHFKATGNQALERKGRLALAGFYAVMGNQREALAEALNAAGTAKVFSSIPDEYHALSIAASASNQLGKYDQEIAFLDDQIRLDSTSGGKSFASTLAFHKILALRSSHQTERARAAWQVWKRMPEAKGYELASSLYFWGVTERQEGYPDSALRAFSQALEVQDVGPHVWLHYSILAELGCLSYKSGHYDDARMFLNDARKSVEQREDLPFKEMLDIALVACDWKGNPRKQNGRLQDLLARCDRILSECRQADFAKGAAMALFLRARIGGSSDSPDTLLAAYLEALSLAEKSGDLIPDETTLGQLERTLLEGEHSGWYDAAMEVACGASKCDQALDLLERKNLQDISSFFTRVSIRTPVEPLNQTVGSIQWRRKEAYVLGKDIRGELSLGKELNLQNMQALESMVSVYAGQLEQAETQLRSLNGNLARILSRRPPGIGEVRDTLPAGSALLEYAPLSEALEIFVVTRDTSTVHKVIVTRSRLNSLIAEYTRLMADPRLAISPAGSSAATAGRINELAVVLGNFLFEPVLPALRGASKLYVVPPREFGWLPFHTLKAGGVVMCDRFSVSYLPTAAALFFSGRPQKPVTSVIGIGHHGRTNWDVEYELKDIRGFYEKARMLFSSSASLKELDTAVYDVLHFAAEFTLDTSIPDNSALVLSDSKTPFGVRPVGLGEFFSLRPAEAILLSNITPEPGQCSRYAPLALLADGTPTVIVTMWQGDRKAKKYFGEVFYTSLQAGLSPADSYQNAIVALGKRGEFAPLYRRGLYYQFGR